MSLEKFLNFLIAHNATIIEMLLGLTLLVVLFLSVRMFLSAKEPVSAGGAMDLGNLEATLKQILEKAGQVPTTASAGSSEDSQKLVAEIANLKSELEAKQKQIEAQASAPAATSSAGGISPEDKSKLEAQLADLQAKLSEYEIISEDIADLSFYKEQNAKLQKDLEVLKAGGAVTAVPATPAAAVEAPAVAVVSEPAAPSAEPEIVGKSKAQSEEPAAFGSTPAAETGAAAPAAADNLVDDDLMAEFAAAVERQKTDSGSESGEPTAVAAPATAASGSGAPVAGAIEASADLGQMDMDKMIAEAAEIKTDVPDVDPEKALGTGVDENKLIQEAAALEGVSAEDQKLMGEFENFVKKNES
jgi:hypothetical protein